MAEWTRDELKRLPKVALIELLLITNDTSNSRETTINALESTIYLLKKTIKNVYDALEFADRLTAEDLYRLRDILEDDSMKGEPH